VTFLFTDIKGSTRLWDEHPAEMAGALAVHDRIVRDVVVVHGGVVFATGGDGFAVAFGRAADAVAAAVAAQRRLLAESWPDGISLRVRMGVHTGEAQEREGDYFGSAVNTAARLMSTVGGGHVGVSAVTAMLAGGVEDVEFVAAGPVELRGVREPVEVFGVRAAGVEWSSDALLVERPPGNMPIPPDVFVGREAEIKALVEVLRASRLVTLTGVGGVGKTRLAVETAALVGGEFPQGVWLVELGALAQPEALGHLVATTLGVRSQPGEDPVDGVVDSFRARRALIVLDNCEHLLASVATLVGALLRDCRSVRVLATSREPLGLRVERVVAVSSLDPGEQVELFLVRVHAHGTAADLDERDRELIVAIGARVDGIPLAIELAAGRARSLDLDELYRRLEDRFRLLRGSGRGGVERHQTLRATVAWSYQLLTPAEQTVFNRLSVFAGSFALAAAEHVAGSDLLDGGDLVDVVGGLVDKSMLTLDRSTHPARYRLLETLRQYGEEQLADSDPNGVTRDQHLDYYTTLAEQTARDYESADQVVAADSFDIEWDNLRAARQWAETSGDVDRAARIVVATAWYAQLTPRAEHDGWTASTLATLRPGHPSLADLLSWHAMWIVLQANGYEAALAIAQRGLRTSDASHLARCYCAACAATASVGLGRVEQALESARVAIASLTDDTSKLHCSAALVWIMATTANDLVTAGVLADNHRRAAEAAGSALYLATAQRNTAVIALATGRRADALSAARESVRLARVARAGLAEADGLTWVAAALDPGDDDYESACAELIESIVRARYWFGLFMVIEQLAHYWLLRDAIDDAAVAAGYHDANVQGIHVAETRESLAAIRTNPAATSLFERGKRMSRDEIVAFLLGRLRAEAELA
jgi:predicted ATPase/class 3 adenylate cyclase